MFRLLLPILLFGCGTKNTDDNEMDTGMDEFNDILSGLDGGEGAEGDDGGEGSGSSSGSDNGDGSGGEDTSWNSQWHDAIAGHQFTYYHTVSDYTEKIVYTFCQDGTGSLFWNFVSGGRTGSGSDSGEEQGTWEVVESNQMQANIRIVGQQSGEDSILMEANSSGEFYIGGSRYYREGAGC